MSCNHDAARSNLRSYRPAVLEVEAAQVSQLDKNGVLCQESHNTPKYIVANLDEGDPGVFANRTLAEADPHAIIEGMLIAAYAVGAEKGYIYIRSEYPLAIQTLAESYRSSKSNVACWAKIFWKPTSSLTLNCGSAQAHSWLEKKQLFLPQLKVAEQCLVHVHHTQQTLVYGRNQRLYRTLKP